MAILWWEDAVQIIDIEEDERRALRGSDEYFRIRRW
jgi:hypothetical protein